MAEFDFLASHAQSLAPKPAVILGDRMLDFASLNRSANRMANAFKSLGCVEGDRVASMSFNSIEGFITANAARRVRMVVLPTNYRLRGAEVSYLLNDSGAKVVIAGPDHVDVMQAALPELKGDRTVLAVGDQIPDGWLPSQALLDAASDAALADAPADGLAASMIYTSGTTGHPKGAWRPHGVEIAYVLNTIGIFELSQSDVHLMCGPGYHSAVSFFAALHQLLGATIVAQRKFEADEALDLIVRNGVTNAFMSPTLLQRLVDAQQRRPRDVPSLRALILGAAPCPYPLKVQAEAAFGKVLWEFYGATETGINTVLRPEDQLRKPGSCGAAMPGQEIRLVDANGNEVPDGEPGELMVRNTALAEYYNRPDATGKSLHDGFFSVGDVAYKDAEGYYFICDRKIDMIISGGVNIYPAEIEAVLHAHPAVMDAAVIGVPDEQWGESVKAGVQLRADSTANEAELIAFCADRLASYKKPRSIDLVDELPRDPAGKLLKRKSREPYWASAGRRI